MNILVCYIDIVREIFWIVIIIKAKKNKDRAFPSNEIESLTEIAYKVVAKNFNKYPELAGVKDPTI